MDRETDTPVCDLRNRPACLFHPMARATNSMGGNEIPPSGGGGQEWPPHFKIGGKKIPPSDSKHEGRGAFASEAEITASWPAR